MGRVVGDAKRAPDHLGDASTGPDLAPEAICFWSRCQERRQLGQLLAGEPWLAPRGGMASQRRDALLPCPREPLADRSRRHAECGGDVLLFPALLRKLPGAPPPPFAPIEPRLGLLRAHDASVSSL